MSRWARVRRNATLAGAVLDRWRAALVGVIGCGNIGSRFAIEAARSGAGVWVCDPEIGESSNLGTQDVRCGEPKALWVAESCNAIRPRSATASVADIRHVGVGLLAQLGLLVDCTDDRCATGVECLSGENNLQDSGFGKNWNTQGGCGWQTRAPRECSFDATRGCFATEDCAGTCHVLGNEIVSTLVSCVDAQGCADSFNCSAIILNPNTLQPCVDDSDCGDVPGACVAVTQSCEDDDGTCGDVVGDHTGGVWHTGKIGTPDLVCTGTQASACANYKAIAGTNGILQWWDLLVTPVMEKVNTAVNADGSNTATIEIFDWGWNTNINLSDENAAYTWDPGSRCRGVPERIVRASRPLSPPRCADWRFAVATRG